MPVSDTKVNLSQVIAVRASLSIPAQALITAIMRITRQALNAAESSILLSEEEGSKLIFSYADGPFGNKINRLKISKKSGIAGLTLNTGKPMIANDARSNRFFNAFTDELTGHETKSIISAPMVSQHKVLGVIEVLNKLAANGFGESDLKILTKVTNTITQLIESIQQSDSKLIPHKIATKALLSAVEAGEAFNRGHARRVREYVVAAAEGFGLSREERQNAEYAAIMHDIGKFPLDETVPISPHDLNDKKMAEIRKHPVSGFKLLQGIEPLRAPGELVLCHHERYDGTGYPKGLAGDDIPAGARLIAAADALDNMAARDSDAGGMSRQDALDELLRYAGSKFDPKAVQAIGASLDTFLASGKP